MRVPSAPTWGLIAAPFCLLGLGLVVHKGCADPAMPLTSDCNGGECIAPDLRERTSEVTTTGATVASEQATPYEAPAPATSPATVPVTEAPPEPTFSPAAPVTSPPPNVTVIVNNNIPSPAAAATESAPAAAEPASVAPVVTPPVVTPPVAVAASSPAADAATPPYNPITSGAYVFGAQLDLDGGAPDGGSSFDASVTDVFAP